MALNSGDRMMAVATSPFPLGYFNAGLAADLLSYVDMRTRDAFGIRLTLVNHYWMTGSFAKGDGQGYAEAPTLAVKVVNEGDKGRLTEGLAVAAQASPAFRTMSDEVVATFSLSVNGRRIDLTELSESDDVPLDPYQRHTSTSKPANGITGFEMIRKTGVVEVGDVRPAPTGTTSKIIRNVTGLACVEAEGVSTDTWLELPGASHFVLNAALEGEPNDSVLPTGLAYLASGVAFCFMTQLSRYIEHKRFLVDGLRLSQVWDFPADRSGGPSRIATHLFMNSKDSDVRCEELMRIAVRTCYLHATLQASWEPQIKVD